MLTGLKENIFKTVEEGIMTMLYQIEDFYKEKLYYKKE